MNDNKLHNNTLALNLSKLVNDNYIEYIYRGDFDPNITEAILSFAEANAQDTIDNVKVKKRFYFILVEGLQNITRHQEVIDENEDKYPGLLIIQRIKDIYIITTGNTLRNDSLPKLKEKLEKINSLSAKELKDYAKQVLNNRYFSEKGGAGLGLIEIARKSNNKLYYDFFKINDQYSYFYLQTVIYLKPIEFKNSLKQIKQIHNILNINGIVLSFSGIFKHDKLVNLLSILEKNPKLYNIKNKMFSIIIELLQNIVKHAENYTFNYQKGKYGIFFITETKNEMILTAGNYISTYKVEKLQNFLEKINNLTINELSKLHFQTLLSYKKEKEVKHGLGLIDIRIKSRNPLIYYFNKVDDKYSFFSIQVKLDKFISQRENLIIEATNSTPKVVLSDKEGKFYFCGNSYPENAKNFYDPILKWLEKYSENPLPFTIFEFKFRFLSTPSQQQLIKIMNIIEKIAQASAVVVKWYYEENNEDAMMFGIEFSQLFNIQFDLIETKKIICEK